MVEAKALAQFVTGLVGRSVYDVKLLNVYGVGALMRGIMPSRELPKGIE